MKSDRRNQPVVVGTRFCGGCNPRFDRLILYHRLIRELAERHKDEQVVLQLWEEGATFDLLLLINGCSSECLLAETANETAGKPVVLINHINQQDGLQNLLAAVSQLRKKEVL